MLANSGSARLDPDACYRAVSSRDRRFDGMFYTAVRTTKIYCRPSCPAITPKSTNVSFYLSAAAAQSAGYRACKRCIPDASPGSPDWDRRGDVVARAIQLIDDGVVDRGGVDAVAGVLGYSARHVHRMLVDELGAGPLAIARARRAHTARSLIESGSLSLTDVAFAAGFGSVRQFNDTIRSVYGATPSELRSRRHSRVSHTADIEVHLAARQPFAGVELFEFLAARAVPGIEIATGATYSRTLDLPNGYGIVRAALADGGIDAVFTLSDVRDLTPAVSRVRRLFDLDADPVAIDAVLSATPQLRDAVDATPGLRAAGSVDPWETVVRAIIGQQVSVAGARTVTATLVAAYGEPISTTVPGLSHVFVRPEALAVAEPVDRREAFKMPQSRAETLVAAARAVVAGDVDLGAERSRVRSTLQSIRGIGPWTADYVAMRGLGDPDVFLPTDLGVRRVGDSFGARGFGNGEAWAPWRTYALHHIWRAQPTTRSRCIPPPAPVLNDSSSEPEQGATTDARC